MDIIELKSKPCVTTYINTLQGIINRLANNSAQCKTWCITIVAALLALKRKDVEVGNGVYYTLICLFFFLDSFYLGQERRMRDVMKLFVEKLNENKINEVAKLIYKVKLPQKGIGSLGDCKCPLFEHIEEQIVATFKGFFSFSTLPFYLIFILLVKFVF